MRTSFLSNKLANNFFKISPPWSVVDDKEGQTVCVRRLLTVNHETSCYIVIFIKDCDASTCANGGALDTTTSNTCLCTCTNNWSGDTCSGNFHDQKQYLLLHIDNIFEISTSLKIFLNNYKFFL